MTCHWCGREFEAGEEVIRDAPEVHDYEGGDTYYIHPACLTPYVHEGFADEIAQWALWLDKSRFTVPESGAAGEQ